MEEILAWLVDRSEAATEQFVAAFESQCEMLSFQPFTGRPRDDLAAGLRSFVVERYIVFFEPRDDEVRIHRIIHGSRNITPEQFRGG